MKLTKPLIYFDLETTGLSIAMDRIIQIACIKYMPDGSHTMKDIYINPGSVKIGEDAAKAHNITDEMVRDCPTFEQYAKSMFEYFSGCDIAGYNLRRFDMPLLREEFLRCGFNWDPDNDGTRIIDVLQIMRNVIPMNLQSVHKMLYGEQDDIKWHDAGADVMATHQILTYLQSQDGIKIDIKDVVSSNIDDLHEQSKGVDDYLDYSNKIRKVGERIEFAFGKHKGCQLKEYPGFCEWMLKNDFTRDTKARVREVMGWV